MTLLHFGGDVHQPLHCASYYSTAFPEGDRGGNDFLINYSPNKLHSLADGMFGIGTIDRSIRHDTPEQAKEYYSKISDLCSLIKNEFPEDEKSAILEAKIWAEESADIARKNFYKIQYGDTPTPEYIATGQTISKQQVALAGYRLGNLLKKLLKTPEAIDASKLEGNYQ